MTDPSVIIYSLFGHVFWVAEPEALEAEYRAATSSLDNGTAKNLRTANGRSTAARGLSRKLDLDTSHAVVLSTSYP
jgi:hypothetical protein